MPRIRGKKGCRAYGLAAYEVNDNNMKMYLAKVKEAMEKFHSMVLLYIPRSENAQADAVASLASSALNNEPRSIMWEVLPTPSINAFVEGLNRTDS